jgi:hypothetical protein
MGHLLLRVGCINKCPLISKEVKNKITGTGILNLQIPCPKARSKNFAFTVRESVTGIKTPDFLILKHTINKLHSNFSSISKKLQKTFNVTRESQKLFPFLHCFPKTNKITFSSNKICFILTKLPLFCEFLAQITHFKQKIAIFSLFSGTYQFRFFFDRKVYMKMRKSM